MSFPQINPNIPLEGKPVTLPDPLEAMARVQSIKSQQQNQLLQQQSLLNSQQQNQMNALNIGQTQKQIAGINAEAASVKANTKFDDGGMGTTDTNKVYSDLMGQGFVAQAQDYRARDNANKAAQRAARTAELTNEKTMLENAAAKTKNQKDSLDLIGQLANPVVDAARGYNDGTVVDPNAKPGDPNYVKLANPQDVEKAYQQSRATSISAGLVDPKAQPGDPNYLPPSILNPDQTINQDTLQAVRGHATQALTAAQAHTDHMDAINYALRLNEFNQKVHQEAPTTAKAWTDLAGQVMGSAGNDPQWQAGLGTLKAAGMPANLLSNYDQHYADDKTQADGTVVPGSATRAANLGTTPIQRSTEQHRTAQEDVAERNAKVREDREARMADAVTGLVGQLKSERANQIIEDDINNTKSRSEANIQKNRTTDIQNLLKKGNAQYPMGSEQDVIDTLRAPIYVRDKNGAVVSGKVSQGAHDEAQKAMDGIQALNAKYAPQLQGVNDRYADAIDKHVGQPGTATRFNVDPKTLEYKERAAPAEAPAAAVPAAAPPAAPGPAATAPGKKQPQTWNVGGQTYTEGQTLYTRDGKAVTVTGVANGKVQWKAQ